MEPIMPHMPVATKHTACVVGFDNDGKQWSVMKRLAYAFGMTAGYWLGWLLAAITGGRWGVCVWKGGKFRLLERYK